VTEHGDYDEQGAAVDAAVDAEGVAPLDGGGEAPLTLEQMAQASELGKKLIGALPLVDSNDLIEQIAAKSEEYANYLLQEGEKSVDDLKRIASRLLWWNVLLSTKLRDLEAERKQRPLVVSAGSLPR